MLTRLRLKNFKSWADTSDIALKPITAIFGANSSGKTSLLQAFLLLKQTAESSDRAQPLQFGEKNSYVNLGDYRSVIHQHDLKRELQVELDWTRRRPHKATGSHLAITRLLNDARRGFETRIGGSITAGSAIRAEVRELCYRIGGEGFGMRLSKNKNHEEWMLFADSDTVHFEETFAIAKVILPRPIKCYGFPDEVRAAYRNAGFLSDMELDLEQQFANINYLGPLRAYPERNYNWSGGRPTDVGESGQKAVEALLSSRISGPLALNGAGVGSRPTLEDYVAFWMQRLGLIEEFRIDDIVEGSQIFQVRVRREHGGTETLRTDVGFGVSQILPIIVLCYYVPQGSTIILEQPEIHLHPAVQSGLADVLIDAVETRGIQIIVESHSEHLLRRFQRRIAEQTLKSEDVALYFCESGSIGSTLRTLELDDYGQIKNWPKDFFGDEFGEIAETQEAVLKRKLQDVA